MSKQARYMLRVEKGRLVPADGFTARRLRERGYRVGDLLSASLSKPRNPGFHRLAHQFGALLADNLDEFEGMDAHAALKRLQWEANIGCEEMGVQVPGVGYAMIRIPESLSFASMDEGRFREVYRAMTRWVAKRYWPSLTPEKIEEMAELMPAEVA